MNINRLISVSGQQSIFVLPDVSVILLVWKVQLVPQSLLSIRQSNLEVVIGGQQSVSLEVAVL